MTAVTTLRLGSIPAGFVIVAELKPVGSARLTITPFLSLKILPSTAVIALVPGSTPLVVDVEPAAGLVIPELEEVVCGKVLVAPEDVVGPEDVLAEVMLVALIAAR